MSKIYVEPFLYGVVEGAELAKKYRIGLELYLSSERVDFYAENDFPEEIKTIEELSIHGPIYDLIWGSKDKFIREASARRLKKTLEVITAKARFKWILIHMGINPLLYWSDKLVEEWIERASETLNPVLNEYKDVIIHVENAHEKDPTHLRKFVEKIEHNKIYVTLDIGHAKVYSNIEPEEWIEVLAPYIREVHVHNNDGNFDSHLPIEEGVIDFEKIFKLLESHVGDPIITLEPINEENLVKDLNWLKKRGLYEF